MGQNSEGYTIRHVTANDLPELCDLLAQLSGPGWNRDLENWNVKQALLENSKKDHIFHWIAVDKSGIQGTISLYTLQKLMHGGGVVGQIEDVVVNHEHRGRGLGKLLVQTAIDKAWEKDCYKTVLDCASGNHVFYEKCGMHGGGIQMRIDRPCTNSVD